jgi:hypothetical protein
MDDGGTFSEGCSHTHANTARTLVLVATPKIALICGLHANCLYVSPKMPRFATHRIGSSGRSSFSSPENLLLNIVDHSPSTTHQRVTLLTTLIHQLPTPLQFPQPATSPRTSSPPVWPLTQSRMEKGHTPAITPTV